jgi:hypothetical protein
MQSGNRAKVSLIFHDFLPRLMRARTYARVPGHAGPWARVPWRFHVSVGISYIKGCTPLTLLAWCASIPLWCAALALACSFRSFHHGLNMYQRIRRESVGFGIQVRRQNPRCAAHLPDCFVANASGNASRERHRRRQRAYDSAARRCVPEAMMWSHERQTEQTTQHPQSYKAIRKR